MKLAREGAESYAAAFNAHDVDKLAAKYTPDADWISFLGDEVGTRLEGRPAIEQFYREFFTNSPQIQVELTPEHARLITPDVLVGDYTWSFTNSTRTDRPEPRPDYERLTPARRTVAGLLRSGRHDAGKQNRREAQQIESRSDEEAMKLARELTESYVAAYNAHDVAKLAARYTPDADWTSFLGDEVDTRLEGRAAIEQYLQGGLRELAEVQGQAHSGARPPRDAGRPGRRLHVVRHQLDADRPSEPRPGHGRLPPARRSVASLLRPARHDAADRRRTLTADPARHGLSRSADAGPAGRQDQGLGSAQRAASGDRCSADGLPLAASLPGANRPHSDAHDSGAARRSNHGPTPPCRTSCAGRCFENFEPRRPCDDDLNSASHAHVHGPRPAARALGPGSGRRVRCPRAPQAAGVDGRRMDRRAIPCPRGRPRGDPDGPLGPRPEVPPVEVESQGGDREDGRLHAVYFWDPVERKIRDLDHGVHRRLEPRSRRGRGGDEPNPDHGDHPTKAGRSRRPARSSEPVRIR